MSTPWFLTMAFITSAIVIGTEMGLAYTSGLTGALIGLPISVSFFLLSVWFAQLWHYAATGERQMGRHDA